MSGLRDEIRSALLLHRPKDVDTTSALALIQEQDLEQGNAKSSGQDFIRLTRPKNTVVEPVKPIIKTTKTEAENKLASLKSFRRRNGLCFKCGEKWSPAHTCPAHVSLHVLEEILDALDIAQSNDDEDSDGDSAETPQEVLTVQSVPVPQQKSRQTLKLLAQIGKHKVLILVDSGSVGTFFSEQLVQHLKIPTEACEPSTFRAADGRVMLCEQRVPQLKWFI